MLFHKKEVKKPDPVEVHFHGKVVHGVMRGADLIGHFMPRLNHLLKFRPFEGTLDVRIDTSINIRRFATMRIEHVLMDGSTHVDAYLAPVKIIVKRENEAIEHECWALRQEKNIYKDDLLELIDREKLYDKLGVKIGDELEIVMFRQPIKRGVRLIEKIKYGTKTQSARKP